jgi:PAS domain S-box-containing protein
MTNKSIYTEQFLSGGGEMGSLIRTFDWTATSLGPPSGWPLSLKTSIAIMLRSGYTIFVWWGPDMIMFYNDAYRQVLGKKHPFALGKPASLVWSEIWGQIGPMMNQVLKEGRQFYAEDLLFLIERKGFIEESYFTFSYSPIPDDEGGIGGVFCACNEETAKVLRQRRLKTLNDLSAATAELKNVGDVFDVCRPILADNSKDIPFSLLYRLHPATGEATLTGYTGFHDDGHAALAPVIQLNAANGDGWPLKQAADAGKRIILEDVRGLFGSLPPGPWDGTPEKAIIIPINQSGQESYGFLIAGLSPKLEFDEEYRGYFDLIAGQIASAIASVQAFEAERRRAEALADIDRAKTAFFSNISHEFRTPLTLMLGQLEELIGSDGGGFSPPVVQSLQSTHRNAMRLLRLVNTLLDFSRIEAGRIQAQYYPVNICSFTRDLASSFRSLIEKAGLQLVVDCREPLDQVYVDREMWEKIVLNLLSNAYKYTLLGKITVRLRQEDRRMLLQVSDTGVGIPANELPRMFERFHRVKTSIGRTHEGTGIGLSLVNELVKLHKGTISIQSKEGAGSTFTVSIPVGKDHLPPEQVFSETDGKYDPLIRNLYLSEVASLPGDDAQIPGDGLRTDMANEKREARVLVVDDNADMRSYISTLLSKRYIVETAIHGKDALEKLRLHTPSLIISDIMMPVMDGMQLLDAVKGNPETAAIPVILLSARAGEEARIEGYNEGADDYLIKPFSAKELLARVGAQIKTAKIRAIAEAHLRNLFMQAPVAIAIYRGPDMVVELANEKVLEFWGKTAEQVLNKPLFEALPEVSKEFFQPLIMHVYATGERYFGPEVPATLNRNGKVETVYVNFTLEAMRDIDGNITAVMVVAHEVTDLVNARKMAEGNAAELEKRVGERTAELGQSNLRLLNLNKDLEQIAFISSHDLQEPLRKIQTFADLLREHMNDAVNAERYIDKIISSGSRMMALIKSVLNYARLSRQAVEFEPVDLNEILEEIKMDFELLIAEKKAVIRNNGLPVIRGIRLQLSQLFANLVSNSLKFTTEEPQIVIGSSPFDGWQPGKFPALEEGRKYIEIVFQDNGIGFEPRYAEQIFAMFQRLNKEYDGTGIGLALCKKIVDNHKGAILAESEVGKGTVFRVVLPAG